MENIIEPTMDFDFSKLQLGIPVAHPGATYVARIFSNNKPLFIQTPKCTTKGGIIQSGKKSYCDLVFDSDDSIFIDWITNLELKCQALITNKSDSWFQTKYTPEEIETAFTSPLKIYKSGKYYLLRVNIKPNIKIYNDLNAEVKFCDINENTHMITIIEFYGIKFTSKNFQIEVELRQSLIVRPDEFLGNCFIKQNKTIQQEQEPIKKYEPKEPDYPPPELLQSEEFSKEDTPLEVQLSVINTEDIQVLEEVKEDLQDIQVFEEIKEDSQIQVKEEIKEDSQIQVKEEPKNSFTQELSEFDFDTMTERLEDFEKPFLCLKRPNDVYYKEYNAMILRANKLKLELKGIYLEANLYKKTYSLNVDNIDTSMDSDINLSDDDV